MLLRKLGSMKQLASVKCAGAIASYVRVVARVLPVRVNGILMAAVGNVSITRARPLNCLELLHAILLRICTCTIVCAIYSSSYRCLA